MKTIDYLRVLSEDIHSVIVATVDKEGLPTTRVIDMMLHDDQGLYFLTAKGKVFYEQLMAKNYISLTGMTGGEGTMVKKAVSFSGKVENIGTQRLDEIFSLNTYMSHIYPTEESKKALEVFRIYEGQGEFFDLSTKPITRDSFTLGKETSVPHGYFITKACISCGACTESCPTDCIDMGNPYVIQEAHCLHCGNCMEVCPVEAVIKR